MDGYRRGPPDHHRGPPMERRGESGTDLSSYYRDRFGSHSPEEYKNLRLSHIDPKLGNGELREVLEREFRRYGDHQVKVVNGTGAEERLAYVNFEAPYVAKRCRKACLPRLQDLLGRYLKVDPAGVIRDQDGRFVDPARGPMHDPPPHPPHPSRRRFSPGPSSSNHVPTHRGDLSYEEGSMSPDGSGHRGGAGKQRLYNRHRPSAPRPPPSTADEMEAWKMRETQEFDATRTLFVGNLPARVDEPHLRKIFSRYGRIEEVDIKSPHEGSDAVYSFIQFENLDQSQEAKYYEDGQIVAGGKRCNIGYGKPVKSRRLFIEELDRYGAIERIDYIRGGNHAYASFVSKEAAYEACMAMKGFPLGGKKHRIRVDFSSVPADAAHGSDEEEEKRAGRFPARPPSSNHRQRRSTSSPAAKAPRRGPRTPPDSPPQLPTQALPPAASAADLAALDSLQAPSWAGALILKKSSYAVRLYRLRGDEVFIGGRLTEPNSGDPIQLHVTQRRPISASSVPEFSKYLTAPPDVAALLLAVPNEEAGTAAAEAPSRHLRDLIKYLGDKKAGGVVSIKEPSEPGGGLLYLFPACEMSRTLLERSAPECGVLANHPSDALLALLIKSPKAVA